MNQDFFDEIGDDIFTKVWMQQMREMINCLLVPVQGDEPPASTCTAVRDEPPLSIEQLRETMSLMRTHLPPEIRVIESELLTTTEESLRQRTWRERLFSRPWRPWRATATESVQVPDPNLYSFDAPLSLGSTTVRTVKVVVGHPSVVARLKDGITQETAPMDSFPLGRRKMASILKDVPGVGHVYSERIP